MRKGSLMGTGGCQADTGPAAGAGVNVGLERSVGSTKPRAISVV